MLHVFKFNFSSNSGLPHLHRYESVTDLGKGSLATDGLGSALLEYSAIWIGIPETPFEFFPNIFMRI